jgi:hypothetical protein
MAHPGSTYWVLQADGAGNFDYNCDGVSRHNLADTISNCYGVTDNYCTNRGLTGTAGTCQAGQVWWTYTQQTASYNNDSGWHQAYGVPACGNSTYHMNYGTMNLSGVACELGFQSGGTCYGFNLCANNSAQVQYCN